MPDHRQALLDAANAALAGRLDDVTIRRAESVAILNAAKDAQWTGYSPDLELLKGLIVRLDAKGRAVELLAGCLPKFYNWHERRETDDAFVAALRAKGARLVVTEKADGTNIRPWRHPTTGEVLFATRGMLSSDPSDRFTNYSAIAHRIAAARYPALLDPAIVGRYTVVCELISPQTRIITNYGSIEDLVVLAVIDLDTGHELPFDDVTAFGARYGLTIVPRWDVTATDPEAIATTLKRAIAGTDKEGFVASVEQPGAPVPVRIKIKGDDYLRILAIVNRCSIRKTAEIAEGLPDRKESTFLAAIRSSFPDVPEEVVDRYRAYWRTYQVWDAENEAIVDDIVAAYLALPTRDADQKTFALSIANDERRTFFFALRKEGVERGRASVAKMVRKARYSVLAAIDNEDDTTEHHE
jgi:hypothetical protein